MTLTVEICVPFWRRLRFLFGGGRIYAQAFVWPSWHVHLETSPGSAWLYYNYGNVMLTGPKVHGDSGSMLDGSTLTLHGERERCDD